KVMVKGEGLFLFLIGDAGVIDFCVESVKGDVRFQDFKHGGDRLEWIDRRIPALLAYEQREHPYICSDFQDPRAVGQRDPTSPIRLFLEYLLVEKFDLVLSVMSDDHAVRQPGELFSFGESRLLELERLTHGEGGVSSRNYIGH